MSGLTEKLHRAVHDAHVDEIKNLLERGASVNGKFKGETALHVAATHGNVEVADLLIRNRADINAIKYNEQTPLHTAANTGNVQMTELLIRNGADLNTTDLHRNTPLYIAVMNKNAGVTDLLIRNKANLNGTGDNILYRAAELGNVKEINILLASGASVDYTTNEFGGQTALYAAKSSTIAEILIQKGALVNFSNSLGKTPLHLAAINNKKSVADVLVRNKADFNATDKEGNTPLHDAVINESTSTVEELIRLGANCSPPNNQGDSPLHQAASLGLSRMVITLIQLGANISATNYKGDTPLHQASMKSKLTVVEDLIRFDADTTAKNSDGKKPLDLVEDICRESHWYSKYAKGESPLHQATRFGEKTMANVLVSLGGDLSATNKQGDSPLHQAALHGEMGLAENYVNRGAKLSAENNKGDTPLHSATMSGDERMVETLVRLGAKLSAKNNNGDSPLHQAIRIGEERMAETLVSLGADLSARNNEGRTPYELAEHVNQQNEKKPDSYKYQRTFEYLQEKIDNVDNTNEQPNNTGNIEPEFIDDPIIPKGEQSNENKKEKHIELPWLVNANEFHHMMSHGEFRSYENRLSLGGPCKAGKSTLASVLIGEDIPLKWDSTDGLVIYFGRNGINIEKKTMVPLGKGERGHEVFAKILRGTPNVNKQPEHVTTSNVQTSPENLNHAVNKETKPLKSLMRNTQDGNVASQNESYGFQSKAYESSSKHYLEDKSAQISSKLPPTTTIGIQSLECKKLQLQSNILEEVRNGQYKITIAPSDLIDFGGQKSYDMTHQLFIQHRGSFLLMFDGRFGLHKRLAEYPAGVNAASILKHWVDSILTYIEEGEDIMPMIMFAATHRDHCTENASKLKESFTTDINLMFAEYEKKNHIHLDTVYFINSTDIHDPEIKKMTDQVVIFAMKQLSWGQRRPMQWVPLELQISNMRMMNVNIVTKEDLHNVNLLNEDLALEERQLNDFLLVQHSLGKLMYYNIDGLRNFIIIHPPALVNILRSFVTDKQFWPKDQHLKSILQKLTDTGKIHKQDLLEIWKQNKVSQYMPTDGIQEFMVHLLIHLDILIVPKQTRRSSPDVYLVPCMIKTTRPDFNDLQNRRHSTICLEYSLVRNSIPNALAYKVIGAAAATWPLKDENDKTCLYHKAAILNVTEEDELCIWLESNRFIAYMINRKSLMSISPDVAATVQECLTKNLESALLFYFNSFGKKIKPTKVVQLYHMTLGIPCGNGVCFKTVREVTQLNDWKCKLGRTHETRYLQYWIFDKTQPRCAQGCKGLSLDELKTEPSEKHLVRLGSQIGIRNFVNFVIHLGMTRDEWENIEYEYTGHSLEGIMSVALLHWKKTQESKSIEMVVPTFNDISSALKEVGLNGHVICQIFREDTGFDIADFKLQESPSDEVLKKLSNQVGNRALQLGIELGVNFNEIEGSSYSFQKDLPGFVEDILKNWKAKSKVTTIQTLIKALIRVKGGGVRYLREISK